VRKFLTTKRCADSTAELDRIKTQIYCATNEFNNISDELQIKAAIFRLCELEARRDLIIRGARK
jgi:hypothetical protein